RPSFSHAMLPQQANEMYMRFADNLRKNGIIEVETGVFGADMKVNAFCDGPINIILNTAIWR
ncbi:MAG: D-aminoacyl-tRNA deacylase, partial [Clostridia bacterium]|nr:D-aminoacyl-tRNA deacylase [Clostridia bacterium]